MQEAFLHFIWQYQYFRKAGLATSEGIPVNILHPGMYNTDAGPDFKEAKVQMGDIEWRGHVELHIRSSDWSLHRHQENEAYNNVILHVVWSYDQEILRKDRTPLPTVELKGLIEEELLLNYNTLLKSPFVIPCERQLNMVRKITWTQTLDKVLLERLSAKAVFAKELLQKNKQDWEETAYQLLAKNFGFKINSEPFLILAASLPYKIIKKHADNSLQTEALLFGQAGFLDGEPSNDYQALLSREYAFLKHKYQLQSRLSAFHWKLLRLRPANFPTVRIAQFSCFLKQNLFKDLLEVSTIKQLKQRFNIKQSNYWRWHYQFNKPAKREIASLGNGSLENIAINTVVPLLVAYSQHIDDVRYKEKAISLLEEVKAEKNKITNYWEDLGIKVHTAFDSQALIQLHNEYCSKRRCLFCNVGISLIRQPR